MRDIKRAKEIFEQHGGMMRTSELSHEKIYYADINYLITVTIITFRMVLIGTGHQILYTHPIMRQQLIIFISISGSLIRALMATI